MNAIRPLLTLALILGAVAILFTSQGASADHPEILNPPNSLTVLGDSISRGYSANNVLGESAANLNNNWASGANPAVQSHYTRLLAINPSIAGNNFNHSVSGARMVHLPGQAQNAVASGAELVLIEMGGNDVCTSSEATMTPVATYRAQFQQAMDILSAGLPDSQIFVASVPNVHYLWQANNGNLIARLIWSLGSVCQSLLAQPTCNTVACQTRRANVAQRAYDYSVQLDEVCAQYIHCRFDNYATNSTPFTAAHISTADYFHPSIAGQALLAAGTWAQSFDYADMTAPTTTITPDRDPDGSDGWYNNNVSITLTATDPNSEVSGSEYYYQLEGAGGNSPWVRYTGPFSITAEGVTNVHARSVDVNGNTEEGRELAIKIDKTDPTVSLTCPSSVTLNAAASVTVSASDDRSGFESDPSGTFAFDTSVVGPNLHSVTVADKAGNEATASCVINVLYNFGGFLAPINPDGTSVFKQKSTVPVKFELSDANGNVDWASATIQVAKVSNEVLGSFEEAASTSAASTGNAFRYDEDSGQYIFNLGTKNLSVGTWIVKVTLDDGSEHAVMISLK